MKMYKKILLITRLQEDLQAGKRFLFLVFCFSFHLCNCLYGQSVINDNNGEFVFKYDNSSKVRDIKVCYYAPKKLTQNSRIVFVLHGDSRDGSKYRDEWQKHATKHNFLVLCPELSEKDFSYWEYNCGTIYFLLSAATPLPPYIVWHLQAQLVGLT